ncbi:MAG TPA: plastocyanin/azurin family copper-binding protein [Longimicrobium sp.]|nr:plastocyanin/azurin family copper-binding protein [Longimicrobium sp.]
MTGMIRPLLPSCATLLAAATLAACSGGGGGGGGGGGSGEGGGGTTPQFGVVAGQVTAGGAGLQGVNVSIAGVGSTATDASGNFSIANVPVGSPSVSITVPGGYITANAADATSKTVAVAAGQTASTSFALKRGRQVSAGGTSFAPEDLTVSPGFTVRWVSTNGNHTVTPDAGAPAGAWASAPLPASGSFEHTFTSEGTFSYHCVPHQAAGMTGTVVVAANEQDDPTTPRQPDDPYYP